MLDLVTIWLMIDRCSSVFFLRHFCPLMSPNYPFPTLLTARLFLQSCLVANKPNKLWFNRNLKLNIFRHTPILEHSAV